MSATDRANTGDTNPLATPPANPVADRQATALAVERVRHPLKFRQIQVVRTQQVSPALLRVTFTGEDLADFVSASFDDHIKVFLPAPGQQRPVLPEMGPDGPMFPEGLPRPIARDYTPRRYDAATRELDIEFVLHGDGPGASWAAQAQPGQWLGIGGPRGSFVIPTAFDWHLLIGDEAALPAIARRLEELPAGKRVVVVAQVDDREARLDLRSDAACELHWLYRNEGDELLTAVRRLELPTGEGYVWAAGEAAAMRAVRACLVDERGIDKRRIRASAYWKHGAVGVHETLDD